MKTIILEYPDAKTERKIKQFANENGIKVLPVEKNKRSVKMVKINSHHKALDLAVQKKRAGKRLTAPERELIEDAGLLKMMLEDNSKDLVDEEEIMKILKGK